MPVSPGPEASMGPAEIVKLALQMSIMLTVFGFGLRATVQDALPRPSSADAGDLAGGDAHRDALHRAGPGPGV
jgi:hypothetical protein